MQLLTILVIVPVALGMICRSDGPFVPRPRQLGKSAEFQRAAASLTKIFDDAFAGKIRAGFNIHNTSFSLGIISFDQQQSNLPVYEYHRRSNASVNGTKSIDRESQYMIGSISKAITVATLVRSGIDLDDPITKYLPSLASKASRIAWGEISLRALAGQISGIVPNFGFSEYYYLKEYMEYLGLPTLTNSSYPECSVHGMDAGWCNRQQLLDGMLISDPVAPPQTRPVYSNIAFTLLAYAAEAHTGKNFSQLVSDLGKVLNMPSTRPSPGVDSLGVVPPVPNNWGSDYGDGAPGGGLVSTVGDLSSFLHAILTRNPALGSVNTIRAWLKPHTFIGLTSSQGTPWEISRPDPAVLFPGTYDATTGTGGNSVTIVSKDGVAYGYRARISILDSYGIGLTILTAGDQSAMPLLVDATLSTLIPAIDAAARSQASAAYSGTYTKGNDTARISMDGANLRLNELKHGDKDILFALQEMWKYSLGALVPAEMANTTGIYRLFPGEIYRESVMDGGRKVVEEDWRFEWDFSEALGSKESELPGRGASAAECKGWKVVDWLYYGGQSVDRVVFVRDAVTGEVVGFEAPFLRSGVLGKK